MTDKTQEENLGMDKVSQARLDRILAKPPSELYPYEASFLKARQSYLSRRQLEIYSDILNLKARKKPEPVIGQSINIEKSSYKELQIVAKKMGMDKVVGKNRSELENFIDKYTVKEN